MSEEIERLSKKFGKNIRESEAACSRLSAIKEKHTFDILKSFTTHPDCYHRRIAVIYLAKHSMARKAIDTLFSLLQDPSKYVVRAASEGLANLELPEKTINKLISLMQAASFPLVYEVANILASQRCPRLRALFLPLLKGTDTVLKGIAIRAIASYQDKRDFDVIFSIYKNSSNDKELQKVCESVLGGLVSKSTWHQFFETFSKKEEGRREEACEVAAQFIKKEDEHMVISLTHDESMQVRLAAYKALHAARGERNFSTQYFPKNHDAFKNKKYPRNRGASIEIEYILCENQEINDRVSFVLNEACHIFYAHADGFWRSQYKDYFARKLVEELTVNPWLAQRLLNIKDRVISMVTYRALEIIKEKS